MENFKGKRVIVRSPQAGVFYGTMVERDGTDVELKDARRIWYWSGAATLFQLSQEGVKDAKNCKFTMSVPQVVITGVSEVLPCADEAIDNIESVRRWKI